MSKSQEKKLKDLIRIRKHDDIKGTLYGYLKEESSKYLSRNSDQLDFDYWETETTNKSKKKRDIVSVALRTIIEIKSKDNEIHKRNKRKTHEKQLKRYLRDASETNVYSTSAVIWIGILTDGKYWYKYDYDKSRNNLLFKEKLEEDITIDKIEDFIRLYVFRESEDISPLQMPNESNIYASTNPIRKDCIALGKKNHHKKNFKTKLKLWRLVLSGSGILEHEDIGHPKTQELFYNHSFMVVTSRLIIAYLDNPGIKKTEIVQYLGDGFHAWIPEDDKGFELMCSLLSVIKSFDWKKTSKDILKYLYHLFIDKENRKEFGEFYTKDFLAENIVLEVLDDDWLDDQIKRAHKIIDNKSSNETDRKHLGVLYHLNDIFTHKGFSI